MSAWLLPALGTASVAIAYLIGFAYLDGYYEFFDIDVAELEYGPQHIFVHCAPVLSDGLATVQGLIRGIIWGQLSPIAGIGSGSLYLMSGMLVIALIGLLAFWYRGIAAAAGQFSVVALIVSTVCTGIFLPGYAHAVGMKHAKRNLTRLHPVKIVDPEGSYYFATLHQKFPNNSLLHLTTTRSTVFLINRFPGGDRWWVIRVPRGDGVISGVYQD